MEATKQFIYVLYRLTATKFIGIAEVSAESTAIGQYPRYAHCSIRRHE